MRLPLRTAVLISASLFTFACGDARVDVQNDELTGVNEDDAVASAESALSTSVAAGSTLQTTANLNLRTGPSTSYSILKVMPQGSNVIAVTGVPKNGWYQIKYSGTTGWSSGSYLKFISAPAVTERDKAVSRAKTGVGFSYWWGHGRWLSTGVTSSTRGACYGSCPSCSHSGSYGADCSGYVAKIWQVPSTNTTLSSDSHPYSTWNFDNEQHGWFTITRSTAKKADAMVYNSNGAGHIFLYESGDPWGSFWAYEAKGCSYGIVHNIRTASSAYKAIRRSGY